MREVESPFGALTANFAASLELAQKVGDPLMIMREAMVETMMLENNLPYQPKWVFTVENLPLIIFIGLKAGGSDKTLEQVQREVFDLGFADARESATEYLARIVGPQPEEKPDSKDKKVGE